MQCHSWCQNHPNSRGDAGTSTTHLDIVRWGDWSKKSSSSRSWLVDYWVKYGEVTKDMRRMCKTPWAILTLPGKATRSSKDKQHCMIRLHLNMFSWISKTSPIQNWKSAQSYPFCGHHQTAILIRFTSIQNWQNPCNKWDTSRWCHWKEVLRRPRKASWVLVTFCPAWTSSFSVLRRMSKQTSTNVPGVLVAPQTWSIAHSRRKFRSQTSDNKMKKQRCEEA